jgi:hypothetical protein
MQVSGFAGANKVGTMITNNAVGHSPELHAATTAGKIVIDPFPQNDPTGSKRVAAGVLRENTRAFLVEFHRYVENNYKDPFIKMDELINNAFKTFIELTHGTILQFHYADETVQDLIRFELLHEFGSQLEFLRSNRP